MRQTACFMLKSLGVPLLVALRLKTLPNFSQSWLTLDWLSFSGFFPESGLRRGTRGVRGVALAHLERPGYAHFSGLRICAKMKMLTSILSPLTAYVRPQHNEKTIHPIFLPFFLWISTAHTSENHQTGHARCFQLQA